MTWVNNPINGVDNWTWQDDTQGGVSLMTPPEMLASTQPPLLEQIPYNPSFAGIPGAEPIPNVSRNSPPATMEPIPNVSSGDTITRETLEIRNPTSPTLGTQDVSGKFAEWIAAGGSGDWEEFRRHVKDTGGMDPGEYDPLKTPGIELDTAKTAENKPSSAALPTPTTTPPPPSPTTAPTTPSITPPTTQPTTSTQPTAAAATTSTGATAPTTPTVAPTLTLDEAKQHTFYLRPDGTISYVKPGQKVAGATPINLTPEGARKLGWKGIPVARVAAPPTTQAAPGSQTSVSNTRTMYENSDGSVTSTPKDQQSTPVQVVRPQTAQATATGGPTLEQLKVDQTPITATSMGLGRWVNDNPMTAVAKATLEAQGIDVSDPNAQRLIGEYGAQLTGKLQGYGPQAENTLNTIAKLAWYRQTEGQQGAPENAPKDYIESWKGAWRTGSLVPLGPSVDKALIDQGIAPPNVHEAINKGVTPRAGTNPQAIDQVGRAFANVQRLAQGDPAQYNSQQQYQQWYQAACSAASFAAMVNAANPQRNMSVGEAVNFLKSKNLISTEQGLLRGSDFTDVSTALNEAIGENNTVPVNMRSPEQVQQHFQSGGGAIMFTGPSGAVWGVPHIYVVTGADANGVNIVDSSRANKTSLTWDQWKQQTANPGMGAGAALTTQSIPNPLGREAQQAQAGGLASQRPGEGGSRRASEAGTGYGPKYDPSLGGKTAWTEDEVRGYQQKIINDYPLPPSPAPADQVGQEGFMREWKPVLDQLQEETGFDAATLMGLIVSESGWGNETARAGTNNYFGLRPSQYDTFATGRNAYNFAVYPDAKSSLARFIGILSHPENTNYRSAFENRQDPNGFISGLITGGYAPASENDQGNWRRIILDVANRYRSLQ